MYDAQLIAPVKSGLSQYYKPFLIERDAFTTLTDCYSQRGILKKREGTLFLGRLPVWNTISAATQANPVQITTTTNHGLATNDMVWIESVLGMTQINNIAFRITVNGLNTFTLQDLNTGNNINGTAYSAYTGGGNIFLPIVGLRTFYPSGSVDQQLVVFHPKQAFLFSPPSSFINISQDPTGASILWSGTKDNFFYTSNYAGAMWITNNVDHIRFWNGATNGMCDFNPTVDGSGTTLDAALLILPYKGRLVALNTTESGTNRFQRARWSQLGTPYVLSDATHVLPTGQTAQATAWRSDIPGKGGFSDADTQEKIVSAEIVNDIMLVQFQYSSWRLRYTGNEVLPFIWERVDTTFGSESTFCPVLFDNDLLYLSRRGIVRGNSNRVERIDLEIPDIISSFQTDTLGQGLGRVFGIRDYEDRLVFWTYGDSATNSNTPNRVLCYNYQDTTWAIFNLSFSCLGRYKQSNNNIWSTWTTPWEGDETTWQDETEEQMNEFLTVGGRVDSVVVQLMSTDTSTDPPFGPTSSTGASAYNFNILTKQFNPYFEKDLRCRLQYVDVYVGASAFSSAPITAITQANPAVVTIGSSLAVNPGDIVYINNITDMSALNNQQFIVQSVAGSNITLQNVNTTSLPAYINQVGILSVGAQCTILDYLDDNNAVPVVQKRIALSQSDVINKYVRVFLGTTARFHQLQITLSNGSTPFLVYPPETSIDNQLNDTLSSKTQFMLQGFVLHTHAGGRVKK